MTAGVGLARVCPNCATWRIGAFRFCLHCGFDYDLQGRMSDSALVPVPPRLQYPPVAGSAQSAAASEPKPFAVATPWRGRRTIGRNVPMLAGTALVAMVMVSTIDLPMPSPVRIWLAVANVLLLPGLAAMKATYVGRSLSWVESGLASLGLSIGIATCVAIGLAASPIGLSGRSFGMAIGAVIIATSVAGSWRVVQKIRRGLVPDDDPGGRDNVTLSARP